VTTKTKAPVAAGACYCEELNFDYKITITHPRKQLPRLNPLITIALERFKGEILAADFHSREYNQVLPELIDELSRIIWEARHD